MSAVAPARVAVAGQDVAASMSRHLALYRRKAPSYQVEMLNGLLGLWQGRPEHLLDIGGGTGVVAQCISELFPVGGVTAIDVVDRFCPDLTIATQVYDGQTIPFADGAFQAATLNNVLHHVPIPVRAPLMREIARTVDGPLYIKDHAATSRLDHWRLAALDAIGNMPFSGQVKADYLTPDDWAKLAAETGWRIAATVDGRYRGGAYAALFPNRLEITMRWERA